MSWLCDYDYRKLENIRVENISEEKISCKKTFIVMNE